ncbi:MAG: biotin transporter BioY [Candidatus Riflebacteria bacterium]|nr:biotin transporter BioY [Candidatus Riflebacteria bacterium]
MHFENSHFSFRAMFEDISREKKKLLFDTGLILAGSWLVAISAQITIPFYPVPFTAQTLAVILVGALLGSRRGALSLVTYLLQGAIGLPAFAEATGGLGKLLGPTGGYIIGFIPAAFFCGYLIEHGFRGSFTKLFFAMLAANTLIYLFGIPQLAIFVGWKTAFQAGFLPFIPGDILKAVLAVFLLPISNFLILKIFRNY